MAVTQILLAIYEVDFLPCSYGYRPGLGAHDAIQSPDGRAAFGGAPLRGGSGHQRILRQPPVGMVRRMLEQRIDDGALLNLIRKWLRAGILEEDGQVIHPDPGTPQGGMVSPVLANIYLHYVLDLWFERVVRNKNRGRCRMIRYADDFVACFEYRHEAAAFEKALKERLAEFGLEVAPDKTKTMRFGRNGGPHNGRFDFLGFEFCWEAGRKGQPRVKRRTARQEAASRGATFDRLDQEEPSPEAEQADEDAHGEVARVLELLRADRQLRQPAALLLGDLPDAAQVAEPAESATELHVASVQSDAGAFPSASTADCGERTETTGDSLLLGLEAGTVTGPVYGLATGLTACGQAS